MLLDEVEQIQNPGLGAAIIWHFARGYGVEPEEKPAPLLYAFLIIPILFNRELLENISSTQKGLRKLEEKLSDCQASLATLQVSTLALRELSKKSLTLAIGTGLITLDPQFAVIRAQRENFPSRPDENAKKILKAAEKLGFWANAISHREFCFIFHLEI